MKIWHTRSRFVSFLELVHKLQSTRSPKLSTGFWWFLVQNEAGTLLVSLLCFVYYFCLVEKDKHFKRRLELCFYVRFFDIHAGMANCWFSKSGMAHPRYLCEILRDMERSDSGSKTNKLKLVHTKYEVNPSKLRICMPKKIFRPQNLGIKSLTPAWTMNTNRAEGALSFSCRYWKRACPGYSR